MKLGEFSVRDLVVVRWHHPGHNEHMNGTEQHVLVCGRCGDSGVYVELVDPVTLERVPDTWCALGAELEVVGVVERSGGRALFEAKPRGKR